MKPGGTKRNLVVGALYVVLFPLMVFVLIGGLAYHTAKNTDGLAEGLSAIPGVSPEGGALSGLVVFVGLFVVLVGVAAMLGGGGDAPEDSQRQAAAAADATPTASMTTATTPEATATATATAAETTAAPDTTTAAPTATPTPTPEPTPTATPTPSEPRHDVGESFVVGSGEQAIRYTVTGVTATDRVGSDAVGQDADGEFVVVSLEMENTGSSSLDLSTEPFSLVDSQDRSFDVDTEALAYAEDPVIFEQLNPGVSTSGVLVFDVSPDGDYALEIKPAGLFSTAETHVVEIDT